MTITRTIVAGTLAAGMALVVPAASAQPGRTTAADGFSALDDGEGTFHEDAHGSARIVRDPTAGTTTVSVVLNGLIPWEDYPAHLHLGTCAPDGGQDALAGHYVHDTGGATMVPEELHPTVVADSKGRVRSRTSVPWVAGDEARAVVVHDFETGEMVLCADL